MTQYKSSAELKNMAREQLSGKYGNAILFNLANYLLTFCITFLLTMFSSLISITISILVGNQDLNTGSTLLNWIATIISSIIVGVFNTGNALFCLNIACGRTYSVSNLFYGFQYLLKQSLGLSTVMAVLNAICLLPYDICYYRYLADSSTQNAIIMVIAMLVGYAVLLPLSLSLSQAYFLLLDFPQYSTKTLLTTSIHLMKGRKRKLFYIQLSFFPLMILGVLSFGIGNLWITPYMNLTMAYYFLDIMKPAKQET